MQEVEDEMRSLSGRSKMQALSQTEGGVYLQDDAGDPS